MTFDDLSPRGTETILVVDDDPSVLEMVADYLSRLGYRVLRAADLDAALRVAQERDGRIDLAISDVILGDHNGVEIARRLRQRSEHLPVVFISGLTDGVTDATENTFFVRKPFSLSNLAAVTRHALDHGGL